MHTKFAAYLAFVARSSSFTALYAKYRPVAHRSWPGYWRNIKVTVIRVWCSTSGTEQGSRTFTLPIMHSRFSGDDPSSAIIQTVRAWTRQVISDTGLARGRETNSVWISCAAQHAIICSKSGNSGSALPALWIG